LDWSEVIIAESTGYHGRNVVPSTRADAWKCACNKTVEDVWKCASTAAVAYYMDPRNSLNENYIFQFEQLTYDEKNQTKEGVELILKPCNYAQGKVTYYDSKGNKKTLDKTYVDVIMEASKEYNISPYHLASRIRQEQGAGNAGSMISGTWTGGDGNYKGLYNFFNICAYGKNIVQNGLKYAKSQGWTDPEKSIKGGAKILASGYISIGQDTLYLEKFDVVNGGDGYYSHQYMTNVSASRTEGYTIRNTYTDMGLLSSESKIKFKIPVYKNMPEQICPQPGTEKPVTQDVEITENNVRVRKGKGTNYDIVTTLNKGTKILRIELDNSKTGGYYWDKVVLADGTKGYAARTYLKQIDLQSNCNEQYITTRYTDFRNGPGTSKTTVLKVLSAGQIVTIVEKDKYKSLDGNDWCRIKLSDGTYGYVTSNSFEAYDPTKVDQLRIICTDGLTVRKSPSTSSSALASLYKGAIVTRTERNVKSTNKNYIWDKIITSSGITGYIATRDIKNNEDWAEVIGNGSGETTSEIKGNGFKTSGTNIVCQPKITVANIKAVAKDAIIKKGDTVIADTANVGTGYTLTSDGKTYTIVVLGDVNGDGKASAGDYVLIKNHIMQTNLIKDSANQNAADVNKDGKISAGDYVLIKNYIMKGTEFSL
jgi:beta-N-acetylglucosaminidase